MSNNITIELCAEDRARLDGIGKLLADLINANLVAAGYTAIENPVTTPKNDAGEAKAETPTTTPIKEETPTEAKEDPADEPKITLAEIQQKVVQLCAGFEGTKKAAVREIINAYAKKVSDLPEDKWVEVWDKLTALEG